MKEVSCSELVPPRLGVLAQYALLCETDCDTVVPFPASYNLIQNENAFGMNINVSYFQPLAWIAVEALENEKNLNCEQACVPINNDGDDY